MTVRGREPRAVADFVTAVRRSIDRRGLLTGGERVVLAVSGGADSLAMLHAIARVAPELGLDLHVAHFDHRLRPGSDRDAAFVARQAARLGLPATARAAEETDPIPGLSPEEAARERRQRFLRDVAEDLGASRIATGHTLDDQAETVLMRLLFGTGPRGLGGIPPLRWWFIRPLIDVRRAHSEAFCRALRLRPRQDPTNLDPAFRRNLIRHETIPYLRTTLNVEVSVALARLADLLRDEDVYLHGRMLEAAPPEADEEGGARLPLETLRALAVPLQRRAIRYLAAVAGAEIGAVHTEAVRDLVAGGDTGRRVDLPGPLNASLGYGFLVIGRAPSPAAPSAPVPLAVPGETDLPSWSLRTRTWIGTTRPASWPDGRWRCVLDADRVAFPLRVRRWRTGDRFRPLGMPRSKKVGDFFTDGKVPRAKRTEVPLVVDEGGAICWIAGHRIDDRVKVTRRTRRFLWLELDGGES